MAKGAELITEFLVKEKVPYVFGICGHGNVGMLDALYSARSDIQLISPRHEQVAAHMADGYFRIKHEPVATLTSCGPGSANLPISLGNAFLDSVPFMAVTLVLACSIIFKASDTNAATSSPASLISCFTWDSFVTSTAYSKPPLILPLASLTETLVTLRGTSFRPRRATVCSLITVPLRMAFLIPHCSELHRSVQKRS